MGWPRDRVMTLVEQFGSRESDIKVDIQLIPFTVIFYARGTTTYRNDSDVYR